VDKATKIHIFLSGFLAATSISALYFLWNGLVSGVVIILVNAYLIAMLLEAAFRSAAERKVENHALLAKPARFFSFPARTWTWLLIIFIVSASISGFANMYIYSADIVYIGPVLEITNLGVESKITIPPASILETRIEALYFSLVTMITLGYGDFLPVSTAARMLVMWQLATGGLLVIGVFPLIISRDADF
jgi:voltage-gated potassium channel Kch